MMTIYGIPNCDVMKKAMTWLNSNKLDYTFHDYKKDGISKAKLEAWCKQLGWELLLNKKSTTWRELPAAEQEKITTQAAAIKLMMTHTSIIKRPVLEYKNGILVGFKEGEYAALKL
jgi:arsenate reductase (glutaredoxin)